MGAKINYKEVLEGKVKILYGAPLRNYIHSNNILGDECMKCKLKEWMGKKLSLEIDHIDGDNWNNKIENLKLLCPNCHSITPTYRSKKIKSQKPFLDDEKFINEIKKGGNTREILQKLNLDGSGGNYKRVTKICNKYNLSKPQRYNNSFREKLNEERLKIGKFDKLTSKPLLLEELRNKKVQEKIKVLQLQKERIIKEVNFDKKGWGVKVAKILGIVPQAVKQWMVREMPEFYAKCWSHKDNKI